MPNSYPPTKQCSRCRQTLPRSEFYKSKSRPDGIQTVCKACTKLNNREWRDANPKAYLRHYVENPLDERQREARRLRAQRWLAEHPEQARANSRRWYAANIELGRALARRSAATYNARKLSAFVEHVDPRVVLKRDKGICGICQMAVDPQDFHVDHVVPLARGGEHSYRNTQVAHPFCNRRKGMNLQTAS